MGAIILPEAEFLEKFKYEFDDVDFENDEFKTPIITLDIRNKFVSHPLNRNSKIKRI